MLNEMVHLGCTDQTQATVHLVIVLPRIQKSGTGDDNFLNGKEINDQTSQRGPPSKLVPNILVRPNRNGPLYDVTTRISGIWG